MEEISVGRLRSVGLFDNSYINDDGEEDERQNGLSQVTFSSTGLDSGPPERFYRSEDGKEYWPIMLSSIHQPMCFIEEGLTSPITSDVEDGDEITAPRVTLKVDERRRARMIDDIEKTC